MIHATELKIRTFHTDAFGHVNNSRYLELLEEARWQYAEDIGLIELMNEMKLGFIIVDLHLRFRKPVAEGETIVVHTSLNTLGTASGDVRQRVYLKNELENATTGKASPALKGEFHFILIDRATAKSVPIEGSIRQRLLDVIDS